MCIYGTYMYNVHVQYRRINKIRNRREIYIFFFLVHLFHFVLIPSFLFLYTQKNINFVISDNGNGVNQKLYAVLS